MKSGNSYESPEALSICRPVRGPNWFVILFWALIPVGSVIANIFLKRYYADYGIDLSVISKTVFSWNTPFFLAVPATAIIVAMFRIPHGKLRFWVSLFAVFFGSMVILVCVTAYLMPWISLLKAQGFQSAFLTSQL